MVKSRGIEICVISQLDICKLLEYFPSSSLLQTNTLQEPNPINVPSPLNPLQYPTISCYIPIYPGCQIWFEYTIDGPHPPGAAYFFKMSINNNHVTSWDCTAKHGYHGKMMYNLVSLGVDPKSGQDVVQRQALKFGDELNHPDQDDNVSSDDCIQINVHRIEHRQRIKELEVGLNRVMVQTEHGHGLRLTDNGLLEPGFRPRRYKYQLLDAKDTPYASFRFICRPMDYLVRHNFVPLQTSYSSDDRSDTESVYSTSSENHKSNKAVLADPLDKPQERSFEVDDFKSDNLQDEPVRSPVHSLKEQRASSPTKISVEPKILPVNDTDDDLSVQTKDSIEELPTKVPRSPQALRSPRSPKKSKDDVANEPPPSPSKSPRNRHRLSKKLTVNINGANFDLQKSSRPLSPFTAGGLLRTAIMPRTAPPSMTEFGPSIEEEVRTRIEAKKNKRTKVDKLERTTSRTTSTERGGKTLMRFIGRRIASSKTDSSS